MRPPTRHHAWLRAGLPSTILALFCCSCGSDQSVDPDELCPAAQWAVDTGRYRTWRHDCEPYVGDHFTVYSDASSTEAKATLATIAEEQFSQLTQRFAIQSDAELDFTPGYTYYVFALKDITPPVAEGYRNGFIIGAVDGGPPPGYYARHPDHYERTVKHEIMHILQFTLTGCPSNSACPYWLDVWFREGQAVVESGSQRIPTLSEYRAWVSDDTHLNPLRIRRFTDFPDQNRAGEYYGMFGLIYAYLTDAARGHGATIGDCRNLFQYMKDGDPFTVAFERAFQVNIPHLEENFFVIMEHYLGG
jgi:hypothetical protein